MRGGLVLAAGWTAVVNTAAVSGGSFATVGSAAAVATTAALLVPGAPWWAPPVVAAAAAGWFGWPFLFLLVIAVVDLAARRRVAWAVVLGVAALTLSALVGGSATLWVPQQFGSPLFLLLGVVVGLWSGSRRRLITALEEQVAQRDVERGLREEQARASERARIAAEMHDVLAHRLSLIALHTGVLEATSDSLPPKVAERAALLRTASTEALDDLRSVLTVLREPDPTDVEPPTTGDLDELVGAARAAGQEVGSSSRGRRRSSPPAPTRRPPRRPRGADQRPQARRRGGRRGGGDLRTAADHARPSAAPSAPGRALPQPIPATASSVCASGCTPSAARSRSARATASGSWASPSRPGRPRRRAGVGGDPMIRVMVVDDDALVRMGLVDLLETDPDLEVVAQAADGQQALDAASTRRVDVALVDVRMPVMNGIAATARLRALPHPPRVVVLTTFDVDEYVYRALAAGADGFLLKDTEPREILRAVHVVAAGSAILHPRPPAPSSTASTPAVARRRSRRRPAFVASRPARRRSSPSSVAARRTREVADELGMREATVKAHVSRILEALHVTNRVQAALVARDAGLGDP